MVNYSRWGPCLVPGGHGLAVLELDDGDGDGDGLLLVAKRLGAAARGTLLQ